MKNINQSRYEKLVANAKARNITSGYFEVHHIVPKSEGGTNDDSNLVSLTAREHFLAHWLLYRIYKTPAASKAFRLMVNDQRRRRGRDYEKAKTIMSESMLGDNNVSRRPEVRKKLKENCYSPFAGKKRPEHSEFMKKNAKYGSANFFYGKGDRQAGEKNHMARKVYGFHVESGYRCWLTLKDAAAKIGVTSQAICQALRKNQKSKGWQLRYEL